MSISSSTSDISTPDPDKARQGRVRWRRFAPMMLGSIVGAAVLVVMTAQGALAAQFSISGAPFVITSSHLHGDGFQQFATIDGYDSRNPLGNKTNGTKWVMVSAIHQADLTNLCQSIQIGGLFLKLTAGAPDNHVKATDMVVDSIDLSGSLASFSHINIGQDADTMDNTTGAIVVGNPADPKQRGSVFPGDFGQQAQTVEIDGLRQTNYAATAASFTLPNLSMSFGDSGC